MRTSASTPRSRAFPPASGASHRRASPIPRGSSSSTSACTQDDILDFCRNPAYKELAWPADYWPPSASPPTDKAWDESIAAVRRDRAALEALAEDSSIDLFARIPHGTGQTYLRELLLVADHTAYHVGQLVAVRQSLDAWK